MVVVVVVEVVEVVANCVCIDVSGTDEFCFDIDISHWTVLLEGVSDSEIMEEYPPSAHTKSNINKCVGVQRQIPRTSTQEKENKKKIRFVIQQVDTISVKPCCCRTANFCKIALLEQLHITIYRISQ